MHSLYPRYASANSQQKNKTLHIFDSVQTTLKNTIKYDNSTHYESKSFYTFYIFPKC